VPGRRVRVARMRRTRPCTRPVAYVREPRSSRARAPSMRVTLGANAQMTYRLPDDRRQLTFAWLGPPGVTEGGGAAGAFAVFTVRSSPRTVPREFVATAR